ncbi:MAG: hypothetical protein GYA31_02615 [Parcubacteria group bacterium]|nr:hypothetical protein [Parcubacteria group bacterium]
MPQDSNFYRVYKLAYQDRSESLKALILLALIVSFLCLASLLFIGVIKFFSWNYLISAAILWFLVFALLPIFFLVMPKLHFYFGTLLISIISFAPILLQQKINYYLFAVMGGLFILLILSGWRMKSESNSLIDLNFGRIVAKGSLLLSLSLFLIIGTLLYFDRPQIDLTKFNWHLPAINGITLEGKVDDILKTYIEKQTTNLGIVGSAASQLLLKQTRESLSQMLGFQISGQETIFSLIRDYFKAKWQSFSLVIKLIVYLTMASFCFSLIALFNSVFSMILTIVSWLLLKLLILVKYLKIKRVGVEKEEVGLV